MSWRLANSLTTLCNQINATYPNRNKASDGTIGDAAHAAVQSDHNPNSKGVVTALDITHDPAHGLDIQQLADALIASNDNRIKYIIANRSIWENGTWSPYYGDNPHDKHLHLSVKNYDDPRPWVIKENDMITEPMFRRIWSLTGFDVGPGARQPFKREIENAVGRDFNEFMDYWLNTEPVKVRIAKGAHYDKDVDDAAGQFERVDGPLYKKGN